jgi:ribonuclease Z
LPAYGRNQSAQLLEIDKQTFLIDCGEGTQLQLNKYKIKAHKIDHIVISHLHGDHYLGLVGLLCSMHLQGRKKKMVLYGPTGLEEIITTQLKYSNTYLNYPITFHRLACDQPILLYENDVFSLDAFPLEHRIPCCGFVWREKPKQKRINKKTLPENLSLVNIVKLKKGEDIIGDDGTLVYKNESLTMPAKKSRSYAYCSDTKYDTSIAQYIEGVDLLYHESTFLDDMSERAAITYHSTAKQAAQIAKLSKVDQLLLGHFSARYKDISPFLIESRQVFKASSLAIEGDIIELKE